MAKLLILIFTTLFGWLGWMLGEKIGVMSAYIISSIASLAGIYLGWKINKLYF